MRRPIGGSKVVYEYANRLVEKGHRVNVVHPLRLSVKGSPSGDKIKMIALLTSDRLFGYPKLRWFDISPRVNMLVVSSLEEKNIPSGDVVMATAWQTAEYVSDYSQSKGRKFYLVMDFFPWLGPQKNLEATWRAPFKKIAISSWIREQVLQATTKTNDVAAIPLGIDHAMFRISQDVRSRSNQVCMMYSKAKYKAGEDGIRALEICRAQRADLRVTLFGPDSTDKAVPSWMVRKGTLLQKDLVRIYNQSKVCLCSSVAEGFAFPPAEAMACGCAVVSTDCGGIREYASQEVNALLSPPRDPQALAQNVLRLLKDDDLRLRLAQAGQERIKNFTWEKATDEFEKAISNRDSNKSGPCFR